MTAFRFVLLIATLIALTKPARATPQYHEAMLNAAGTTCPAQLCIACHISASGGGPFTQPFFIAMVNADYSIGSADSAVTAFETLRENQIDTDMDGILDVDEVAQATNPNEPGGPDFCTGAEYGCLQVAPVAPRTSFSTWFLIAAFAILAWSLRRL
jgi:hypothetical protein